MTRMLSIVLITLGSPRRLTGGYLYHLRMAELAPRFDAKLEFASFPDLPFPLPSLHAPAVLRRAEMSGSQAVVVDSIAAAFLGPWLELRPSRLPLIAMLHQPPGGIDSGRLRTSIQSRLDRLTYRHAELLLVASDSLRTHLESISIPPGLIRVVPPGRDVAPETAGLMDLRQGHGAAFLCVANWIERKGILDLLEAFARLPTHSGVLHLAGDDVADLNYSSRVRARLMRPDLAGRVVMHGSLSRSRVVALYRAADVFVLPSYVEPYGTVYGEAMANGLPVVGWWAGNLPHLADHGVEGLLVPPGDIDGLAAAMRRLADDVDFRVKMGEAARRRAAERPTWEQSAEAFFGSIREVVASRA